jgi:hypothetical protein
MHREFVIKDIDRLNRLRIASPCPTTWEQMAGDDRVRFCDLCNLHVYNIGRMTRKEAEALIASSEGRICARLYRRTDGTIITRDCPVGLRAMRRHVAKVAGAVFALLVSLCSTIAGQKPKDKSSCQQQVKITREISKAPTETGALAGIIVDPMGATVLGAKISIVDRITKTAHDTQSNSDGRFVVAGLASGAYDIVIKSPGFKRLELKNFPLAAKETVSFDLILAFDATTETVGVLVDMPSIDTSTPGTLIISGEMLRKFPVNN